MFFSLYFIFMLMFIFIFIFMFISIFQHFPIPRTPGFVLALGPLVYASAEHRSADRLAFSPRLD